MADFVVRASPSLDDSDTGVATPLTDWDIELEHEISISWSAFLRGLDGVAVATKAADSEVERIAHVLKTKTSADIVLGDPIALSLRSWHTHIVAVALEESQRHRASLAVAIAFLGQSGRENVSVRATDLDFVWYLVREALTSILIPYTVSRSSQGFLVVPLSSLIKDGNIEELARLHVWESDGNRGTPDLAIHTHQTLVQSWILEGEGRDHTYEAHSADASVATHAEYGVLWSNNDSKESGKSYKIQPTSSTIVKKGRLRPILLKSGNNFASEQLRLVYANTLEKDEEKSRMFDHLKFVRYSDFLRHGKIPISTDGFTNQINLEPSGNDKAVFIVFLSYRWIATECAPGSTCVSPDDAHRTQYHRMLRALDQLLKLHPNIDTEELGIWIDCACIDQTSYDLTQPGVAAMLINLIQCNAMISLIDDKYYERSWCCVETLMIRTLRSAYGWHLWYEHVTDSNSGMESLRDGASTPDLEIDFSRTKVTYETDRPKLLFLERQTKLIS